RITTAVLVTEYAVTNLSFPSAITSGPDGNLWFTGQGCPSCAPVVPPAIGRITPLGVVTEFTSGISTNGAPLGIATGPDGNLWFTEHYGNRIGVITTAGVVTNEFSTGISADSGPLGITAGPDGNL